MSCCCNTTSVESQLRNSIACANDISHHLGLLDCVLCGFKFCSSVCAIVAAWWIRLARKDRAPEDSARKSEAQKQLVEAMAHRTHIDNNIKFIIKLHGC
ncbi:hypothetical protein ACS0TY_021370 [Phlomoides rotata]